MALKFINSGTKIIAAFMLLLSNTMAFGQGNSSDMVFLKDNNLCTILETIITPENTCDSYSKAINWYVEFKDDSTILVTQSRVANLLETVKDSEREVLTTAINNKIVFLVTKNDKDLYSKSGFSIDLSEFENDEIVFFEDFSVWQVKRNDQKYKIANKRIFKCN